MNHYAGLDLEREPFSNSPDPGFLVATRQHATCLQELEISLRLRRGLNIVTGDIGTGKTTLCRSLLRVFAADPGVDVHLMLDPHFETSEEFLRVLITSVSGVSPDPALGLWQLKEAFKQQIFRLGLVERRLVVLVIDEGQKISAQNLELLREMLNYETNTSKLLQIVIFAQRELEPLLDAMPNLTDRINVRRKLSPLGYLETRRLVRTRLAMAAGAAAPKVSFSEAAILALHRAASGYPRKIVRLAHMAMLEMLIRGKRHVGRSEIRAALKPEGQPRARSRSAMGLAALGTLALGFGVAWMGLNPAGPVFTMAEGVRTTAERPAAQQAPAPLPAEAVSARLAPQAATLLPEDGAQEGFKDGAPTGRLTLLPQQDQGPALRGQADPAPPRLHVAGAEAPGLISQPAALAGTQAALSITDALDRQR